MIPGVQNGEGFLQFLQTVSLKHAIAKYIAPLLSPAANNYSSNNITHQYYKSH